MISASARSYIRRPTRSLSKRRSLAPALLLPSNMYYWAVTPLDAKGNPGPRSEIRSFTWEWPLDDPASSDRPCRGNELYDPKFTWDSVPGSGALRSRGQFLVSSFAARVARFAAPRRQARSHETSPQARSSSTTGTTGGSARSTRGARPATGTKALHSTRAFDNYPVLDESAIKNLRMRDRADPGDDRWWIPATRPTSRSSPGIPCRGVELPGPGGPLSTAHCRNLASGPLLALALAREDGLYLMDAAGRRQPDEPAVPFQQQGRVEGRSGAHSRQRLVRSRPGPQRAAELFRARSGAIGRISTTAPGPRSRSPTTRAGGTCSARLQRQLSRHGRLRAPDSRRDQRLQSALHVEPDRRESSRTGSSSPGIRLLEQSKTTSHPHPGLRGAGLGVAAHLPRRDDVVLLGRTSRHRDDGRRSARKRTVSGRLRRLPQASGTAGPRCPGGRSDVLRSSRPSSGRPRSARSSYHLQVASESTFASKPAGRR